MNKLPPKSYSDISYKIVSFIVVLNVITKVVRAHYLHKMVCQSISNTEKNGLIWGTCQASGQQFHPRSLDSRLAKQPTVKD